MNLKLRAIARLTIILAAAAVSLPAPAVFGLPQFAVTYKQNCQLCHVNPTGGGMRTLYGAQFFSHMELPSKPLAEFSQLDSIQPQLSRNVQIGADFRAMLFNNSGDLVQNSFIAMQGDLYLAFTPSERAVIYLEKGLHSGFEAFALIRGLPLEGALKAGRFIPHYGWRFVDHKAYTRDYLGYAQFPTRGRKVSEDVGVELGFYPMSWEASLALTNGAAGPLDSDKGKAVTARAQKRLSFGAVDLTIGGSYRYGEIARAKPLSRYAGGLWGLGAGRLVLLGEADWVVEGDSTGLVSTHLLTYRLLRGVDLNLAYDRLDPNIDLKSGDAWRGKVGLDWYVTGYLEIAPAVYINDDFGMKYTTGEVQLHLWF